MKLKQIKKTIARAAALSLSLSFIAFSAYAGPSAEDQAKLDAFASKVAGQQQTALGYPLQSGA